MTITDARDFHRVCAGAEVCQSPGERARPAWQASHARRIGRRGCPVWDECSPRTRLAHAPLSFRQAQTFGSLHASSVSPNSLRKRYAKYAGFGQSLHRQQAEASMKRFVRNPDSSNWSEKVQYDIASTPDGSCRSLFRIQAAQKYESCTGSRGE